MRPSHAAGRRHRFIPMHSEDRGNTAIARALANSDVIQMSSRGRGRASEEDRNEKSDDMRARRNDGSAGLLPGYETKAVPSDQERMRFMRNDTLDWPEGAHRAETRVGDYTLNAQHFHIVSEDVGRDAERRPSSSPRIGSAGSLHLCQCTEARHVELHRLRCDRAHCRPDLRRRCGSALTSSKRPPTRAHSLAR